MTCRAIALAEPVPACDLWVTPSPPMINSTDD